MNGRQDDRQQPPGGYSHTPGETGITLEVSTGPIQLFTPRARVNGTPVPHVDRGVNHIFVSPGVHQLEVTNQQFLGPDFGAAHARVPVFEGYTTHVYYTMPVMNLLSGAIGPEHRTVPGTAFAYALVVFLMVSMIVCFVMAARS